MTTDNSNPIDQTPTSTEQVSTPAQAPAVEPAANPAQSTDPNSLFADQLASIKSDDGRQKYADVPTALSSIPHAQGHIQEQADKIKQLEEELAKRQGMEQVLEQLKSQGQASEQPSGTATETVDVAALVDAKLQERELVASREANRQTVLAQLSSKFGEKAEERFNEKAAQLGVNVGFLSDLAMKAPEAVLAYFGETPSAQANPTTGSVNTSVLDSKPQAEPQDYMKVFRSGDNDLVDKWRQARKQN